MVWIYIILAIAAVIGALMEFYVRFLPEWKNNKVKRQNCRRAIKKILDSIINSTGNYQYANFPSVEVIALGNGRPKGLMEIARDANISKMLYKKCNELVDNLAPEYHEWRNECFRFINAEIRAQITQHTILDEASLNVFHNGFENVMNGLDGSRSEEIYRAIYKGELTFDIAKESVLKGYWGSKVKIHDKSGEEKELMFREIIDGEDFHRLVEELIRLQGRKSLKVLRDTREKFLEMARLILKGGPPCPNLRLE